MVKVPFVANGGSDSLRNTERCNRLARKMRGLQVLKSTLVHQNY